MIGHKRDYDAVTYRHINFAVDDSKGRLIGAQVERVSTPYVEDGAPIGNGILNGRYPTEPCVLFECRVQATRNRCAYGAQQPWRSFKTEAEREVAIEKAIASARRRAERKV